MKKSLFLNNKWLFAVHAFIVFVLYKITELISGFLIPAGGSFFVYRPFPVRKIIPMHVPPFKISVESIWWGTPLNILFWFGIIILMYLYYDKYLKDKSNLVKLLSYLAFILLYVIMLFGIFVIGHFLF